MGQLKATKDVVTNVLYGDFVMKVKLPEGVELDADYGFDFSATKIVQTETMIEKEGELKKIITLLTKNKEGDILFSVSYEIDSGARIEVLNEDVNLSREIKSKNLSSFGD